MVFGLGKGHIEILLDRYDFSPGDKITGKVSLKLKKPVNAKQLRIVLVGEKTSKSYKSSGGRSSHKEIIHRFEMPLDGEKEYNGGEYPFEIKIPGNVLQTDLVPEGAVGEAVKALNFLSGASTRINWYIQASLDVPRGFDVTKKVQITVG
ncbi:MAG: hypothetical protein B6U72_02105 [Candidatus Altiarchaeales archaeon ex4484_2]|nr:MAG: hypothetical protein B6U72_02105 [Candidatus Altiarchaeales archaeon ex4484_2]